MKNSSPIMKLMNRGIFSAFAIATNEQLCSYEWRGKQCMHSLMYDNYYVQLL